MNAHLQRAELLLRHGRPEDARREIAQHLAEDPNDPEAHALMAECLLAQQQLEQATQAAQTAIGLAPDWPVGHFTLARAWMARNYLDRAQSSLDEAIRLAPQVDVFYALKAGVYLNQGKPKLAVEEAERALAIDPQNVDALNFLAEAHRRMGQRGAAADRIRAALAVDPHDSETHATMGWTCLEEGERDEAMKHFKEALRNDPENERARQGVLHTLKAKNVAYRGFLNYLMWMQRKTSRMQWAILIGAYLLYRFALSAAKSNPQWGWILWPLVIGYLGWVALTWFADPIADLALSLHPFGRLALTKRERLGSALVGGFLGAGVVLLVSSLFLDEGFWKSSTRGLGICSLAYSVCVSTLFRMRSPQPQLWMKIYTLVLGAFFGLYLLTVVGSGVQASLGIGDADPIIVLNDVARALSFLIVLFGSLLSVIVGSVLVSVSWKR